MKKFLSINIIIHVYQKRQDNVYKHFPPEERKEHVRYMVSVSEPLFNRISEPSNPCFTPSVSYRSGNKYEGNPNLPLEMQMLCVIFSLINNF